MIYKEFFTFNLQPSALCQKAKVYTAVQRQRRVCGEVMAFHLIKVVHAVSKRVSGLVGIKGSIIFGTYLFPKQIRPHCLDVNLNDQKTSHFY